MKRRDYDHTFKLQVVRQLITGERTPSQICREHNLSSSSVHKWRQQYHDMGEGAWVNNVVTASAPGGAASTPAGERAKDDRIAALEAALGRAHLETEFLRQALAKKTGPPGRRSP